MAGSALIENGDKLIKWKIKYYSRHFNGTLEMKYETLQIYDCHITVLILGNSKQPIFYCPPHIYSNESAGRCHLTSSLDNVKL